MNKNTVIAIVSLIVVLSMAGNAIATADQRNPQQKSSLEVLDINIDPVGEGKNVLHVTVKNNSNEGQTFGIHIQTRAGRAGWGTQFTETVKANTTDRIRFAFRFRGPIGPDDGVRLQFYNPDAPDQFDFDKWFRRIVYRSGDLEHRQAEKTDYPQASQAEADRVISVFRDFQTHIKNQDFTTAWTLCTRDYLQADQILGLTRWWESNEDIEAEDVLPWDMYELIELRPESVVSKGKVLCLRASREGETWMIDFAQVDGQWKIDWISGYTRNRSRDQWKERLLPRLEKHSTKHFDIYYFKDSTAEREIDRIAETREQGYEQICNFLGKDSEVRICMVLFETEGKKRVKTGHQGAGWATGHTIVEVYNEKQRLDPYHETVHILMGPYGNPPALFNEGFAVYMSERLGAASLQQLDGGQSSIYSRVRELKAEDDLIELDELLTYTEIGPQWSRPPVAYPEAASFVKFLIDTYGRDKFLQAYGSLQASDDRAVQQQNLKKLEEIYDAALSRLKEQWQIAFSGSKNVANDPTEAIFRAFEESRRAIRDRDYETAWSLQARSLQAQYSGGFEAWREQIISGGPRTALLNLQPESVTVEDIPGLGKVHVMHARYQDQLWHIAYVQEDGRWQICEGRIERGVRQGAP